MPHHLPKPSVSLAFQLGLVLLVVAIDLMTSHEVVELFKEGRGIERMSALLLLGAAGLWFVLGTARGRAAQWHIPVILVLMAMREMDFDKRFTSEGLLQLRLYSGGAPLWEKAIGAAVLALILICGLRLMLLNLPAWWRGLWQGSRTCWLTGGAALLLIVAKTLDGLERKLAPHGIEIDPMLGVMAGRFEEVLELVMAILLVQAVVYFARDTATDESAGKRPVPTA